MKVRESLFTPVTQSLNHFKHFTFPEYLSFIYLLEEVRKTLFFMHPEKTPRPDGMRALFFQQSWHIVKLNILTFIKDTKV